MCVLSPPPGILPVSRQLLGTKVQLSVKEHEALWRDNWTLLDVELVVQAKEWPQLVCSLLRVVEGQDWAELCFASTLNVAPRALSFALNHRFYNLHTLTGCVKAR